MSSFSGSNPTDSSNTVCVFTSSGSFVPQFSGTVEVLVVAGGGGGGMDMGGGGGGGGVIHNQYTVTAGVPITVTVGAGGNGAPAGSTNGQPGAHQFTISATQGGNSVFGTLTAIGGGFGASSYYGYLPNSGTGGSGGSGGGCSAYTHGGERYVDNNNTPGQGFPGGNSGNPTTGADDHYSGGGGGAGARGTSGPGHAGPNGPRADGGIGVLNSIMGVPYYWAGGGGGACHTHTQGGNGGLGGGGGGAAGGNGNTVGVGNTSGINPSGNGGLGSNQPGGNGGVNTGGGGGGGSHYNANNKGGDGGSGIVVVRFSTSLGSAAVTNANIINTDSLVLSFDAANIKSVPVFSAEVLVVAGGGGGGSDMGGGGGGGGVVSNSNVSMVAGTPITVTVGAGGNGAPAGTGGHATTKGTNGGDSTFGSITAIGGGAAGTSYYTFGNSWGNSGGSGGGGSGYNNGVTPALSTGTGYGASGAGTAGQGNRGGWGQSSYYSGGGGGAGGAGTDANSQPNGGPGIANSILGVNYFWGGGGGGASYSLGTGGNGGIGGGGGGAVGVTTGGAGLNPGFPGGGGSPNSQTNTPGGNGGANTGGGGGGGSHYNFTNKGGDGGSGIVVVRYPGPQRATGGNITTVGSDTVHTFTTSGTFLPINTWADISGRGFNASLANAVGYSRNNLGSMVMNGVDTVIFAPSVDTIGAMPNQTYEMWVKSPGLGPGASIGGLICPDYGQISYISSDGSIVYYLYNNETSGYVVYLNTTGVNCFDNQWHHIVCTRDSNTAAIYVDGVSRASSGGGAPWRGATIWSGMAISIGNNPNNVGYNLLGNIGIARIYNRSLTAAEVQQNFNALKGRYTGYQTITYTATANMTLTNNGTQDVTMFKTGDNNSWNGEVRSTESFSAPCTIEFSKQAASGDNGVSYVMIGWNQDPTSDTSYSSIDHASYPYRADTYSVYNNGSQVHFSGAWDVNKRFYIVYDTDGFIRHYNGSTLMYSANYGTNRTVFVDSSFYSVNSTFGGLTAVKVARASWNGTNYV